MSAGGIKMENDLLFGIITIAIGIMTIVSVLVIFNI